VSFDDEAVARVARTDFGFVGSLAPKVILNEGHVE
jgi:hypothetical protein